MLRRRRTVALLSMVAVLSAGAGVYVGLPRSPAGAAEGPSSPGSTPGPSPSTTATAAEGSELRRIAPLLQQSARARTSIENAVNEAGACQLAPDQATSIMKKAIITRQDDVGQVEALPAAPIGNGQALLGDLLQALRESSTADQDFITWIDDTAGAGACPLGTDSAWQAGDQESALALAAKTKFVALWNPLARQYALPTFSANDI